MSTVEVLKVSDGTEMHAYISRPSSPGKNPGVLLFQEAFGVNAHIRDVANRLANEGYVVIAPELYHRTAPPGFEAGYDEYPKIQPHAAAMTIETTEMDIRAAYERLKNDTGVAGDRIGSIGFCMGGRVSFDANLILPVKASVSFYGGGIAQTYASRAADLHAPMLMFWGGLDKHILPEHIRTTIDALRAANKTYMNVEISDADHGFFCDVRQSYNKDAAAQAWLIVKQFFNTHLKG